MSNISKISVVMGCLMVLIIGILSIGCAGGPKMIKMTSLVPRSDADTKATKNGVTVSVTPINPTNASQYPVLACEYSYVKSGLLGPVTKTKQVANILPGVTFALKVTNNTGHIIRMSGSEIGLTVGGQDVNKMSEEQILQFWSASFAKGSLASAPPEIYQSISMVPYWNESAKILPGRSSEVFATFSTVLTEGIGGATMAIYDLVTNTDAAGNPSERTNFDFSFKELTTTFAK